MTELIVGRMYLCETYEGLDLALKYKGGGEFADYLYLDIDIRYVKEMPEDTISVADGIREYIEMFGKL